jgi:cytochrome c peroxidase
MKKLIPLLLIIVLYFSFCKKDNSTNNNNPSGLSPYNLVSPEGFPPPNIIAANPLSVEGVKLGRMIFYDYTLSGNGRACASCHHQENAFSIDNSKMGLDPKLYHNIPSLVNKAWQPNFEWYGTVPVLDNVCIADFIGPDAHLFLDPNIDTVVKRLKSKPEYVSLFKQVFKKDVLNKDDVVQCISYAVSQFIRTIVSYDSKFDKYNAGKATLSPAEWRGMAIFFTEKGDCFHCHASALMTDHQFHNIGLDSDFTVADKGRYNITGNPNDMGKFRSPSLRNIALTAPYMHDGRFKTIDEVIEHYNSGMKHSPTLDPLMTLPYKATGLHLTPQDKADLKAFLLTFTDSTLTTNKAYGNPW